MGTQCPLVHLILVIGLTSGYNSVISHVTHENSHFQHINLVLKKKLLFQKKYKAKPSNVTSAQVLFKFTSQRTQLPKMQVIICLTLMRIPIEMLIKIQSYNGFLYIYFFHTTALCNWV